MVFFWILANAFVLPEATQLCDLSPNYFDQIQEQRLVGELDWARDRSLESLSCILPIEDRIDIMLEIAAVEDRIGLHTNARPVAVTFEIVEAAEAISDDVGPDTQASITLAKATYFYRAEMSERKFDQAERLAKRAASLFSESNNKHGRADAVHLLGLIHFQRRGVNKEVELAKAHAFFEQSLALDSEGGARAEFLGDYGRHVGYIHYINGDLDAALPHFKNSLEYRKKAGAIDASLFAAHTLGTTLMGLDRPNEAVVHLAYALLIASKIDSQLGRMRINRSLGDAYMMLGDVLAAQQAYEAALDAAVSIKSESNIEYVTKVMREIIVQDLNSAKTNKPR